MTYISVQAANLLKTRYRTWWTAVALYGFFVLYGQAAAEGNPSVDDMIKSLSHEGSVLGETRGIRRVSPSASEGPAPASTAAPDLRAKISNKHSSSGNAQPTDLHAVSLTVEFSSGSAEITTQTASTLGDLGRALASPTLQKLRFRIEGHTDTVGSAAMNEALSGRRAASVADYLITNFNIVSSRLEAVGMGEKGLLIPTPPQTSEARNRRVKVISFAD